MPRAGITVERLTIAAAELADEVGFEQLTLSAVARHFGVQVASLYSHVSSQHELRSRVAMLALAEMAERAADGLAGRSGRDALAALGASYRDYAREHPGRYRAARYRLDADDTRASAGPRHAELTRAVLRGYAITDDAQRVHAVRLIGSVFHGWTGLELDGAFDHSQPPPAESWERALDGLHTLLTTWGEQ